MSNASEKKNRFQISREVQEDFVNSVAENMLALAEKAGQWQKPWQTATPLGMPFCATTGREYGGANMVKLLLSSMLKNYQDDRWLTFKQMQEVQGKNPDLELQIRKGEKGVKLLRPEQITFTVDDDGKWQYLSDKQVKELQEQKAQGKPVPDVQRLTLFYPFTVFNTSQIDGFPQKAQQNIALTEVERNELVERFIASAGVPVEHHTGDAFYLPTEDVVKMPLPAHFKSTDEYYAAKLHEFYHATGHEYRENRKDKLSEVKSYAFEEIRAEMFSMLVGARFNLPMPEKNSAAYIAQWNQKFSGGEAQAIFKATSESAKMLSLMHQFEVGEQPKAPWFPKQSDWPYLQDKQAERDKLSGAMLIAKDAQPTQQRRIAQKSVDSLQDGPQNAMPRPASKSFEDAAIEFKQTPDVLAQFRVILQNPKFLALALKDDADTARSLASLCDSFSQTLHMELDSKQSAPQENTKKMRA